MKLLNMFRMHWHLGEGIVKALFVGDAIFRHSGSRQVAAAIAYMNHVTHTHVFCVCHAPALHRQEVPAGVVLRSLLIN